MYAALARRGAFFLRRPRQQYKAETEEEDEQNNDDGNDAERGKRRGGEIVLTVRYGCVGKGRGNGHGLKVERSTRENCVILHDLKRPRFFVKRRRKRFFDVVAQRGFAEIFVVADDQILVQHQIRRLGRRARDLHGLEGGVCRFQRLGLEIFKEPVVEGGGVGACVIDPVDAIRAEGHDEEAFAVALCHRGQAALGFQRVARLDADESAVVLRVVFVEHRDRRLVVDVTLGVQSVFGDDVL